MSLYFGNATAQIPPQTRSWLLWDNHKRGPMLAPSSIYIYKDLKVTFQDGKVSEVD
jgi:hypothetical protein